MKKSLLATVCALCLCNAACKKEDDRQYSSWYVNEEPFSTNDVKTDIGKAVAYLETTSISNGFSIKFNTGSLNGGLPTSGSFKLDCSQQNPQWVCMAIFYRDTGYLPKESKFEYLIASQKGGKAQYNLDTSWFYNSYRANDSIRIYGTFNQP